MASINDQVADYVREQGRESNGAVHVSQIASDLGISVHQVQTARSRLIRSEDDIFPCAANAMVYEPGWKEKHPEVWAGLQKRSLQVSAGMARAKSSPSLAPAKRRQIMPNIMGPVTSLYNVVAVNIHPDYVSIQHEDGTWTELTGTVKIKTGGRNG